MTTLKISDLSIGDWIAIETEDLTIEHADCAKAFVKKVLRPICVQSILGEDKFVYARGCCLDREVSYATPKEYLHPIPITPEILKANGWERNEEDEYMEYYGDPTSGIAHTKGTYHYRLESPEASVVCYFVHQLQHALRLAGVNKEIVMPNKE